MTPEQAVRVCAEWCGVPISYVQRLYDDTGDFELGISSSDVTYAWLAEACRAKLLAHYIAYNVIKGGEDRLVDFYEGNTDEDWQVMCFENTPIERLIALAENLEGE